jgi:hypothetical protein
MNRSGAHTPLKATALRTMNMGWVPRGITIPRTITLVSDTFPEGFRPKASRLQNSNDRSGGKRTRREKYRVRRIGEIPVLGQPYHYSVTHESICRAK